MGLSAATIDEEMSTSGRSQDTTVDRSAAEVSSPAKDVLDDAKERAKSVAQSKSGEFCFSAVFIRVFGFIPFFLSCTGGLACTLLYPVRAVVKALPHAEEACSIV